MNTNKRPRRQYTDEFKREAVALVTEQGYSIAHAARSLDIGSNVLCRWKQAQESEKSSLSVNEDEREELQRLRRENQQLRMEQEILKKASAYFAKHMK